jgi:hypothetical protein
VMAATRAGRMRILRLLLEIGRRPRDIAPLIRLSKRYRRARQALVAVARTGALAPLAYSANSPTRIA